MFKCKDGCSACCGVVPIDKKTFHRNTGKLQTRVKELLKIDYAGIEYIIPVTKSGLCIFLNRDTKKCEIYDDRPEICKLYGINPMLPCPYLNPDGSPRTNMKEYEKVTDEQYQEVRKIAEKFGIKL